MITRTEIIQKIEQELERAYEKHGNEPWGRHEFYGIFKEEADEMWMAIKCDAPDILLLEELIQVAAMVVRYLETGDRYRGPIQTPEDLAEEVNRMCGCDPTKQAQSNPEVTGG